MNNKVIVKLIVPEIDKIYDVYLPINKKIGNIINLLNQTISELTSNELELSNCNSLYNGKTGEKYISDILLYHTIEMELPSSYYHRENQIFILYIFAFPIFYDIMIIEGY